MFVGIDLSGADRWEHLLTRFPDMRERIFTAEEIRHCEARGRWKFFSYAALWAAREAAGKALGIGILGSGWQDASLTWGEFGAPRLLLSGNFEKRAAALGIRETAVSVSHERGMAAAVVIMSQKVSVPMFYESRRQNDCHDSGGGPRGGPAGDGGIRDSRGGADGERGRGRRAMRPKAFTCKK